MDPVEAEFAKPLGGQSERPFHVQRQIATRAAAFDAECSHEITRIRAKYPD